VRSDGGSGDQQMRNRKNSTKDLVTITIALGLLLTSAGIIDNPDPV
jgi:hypothetical protein